MAPAATCAFLSFRFGPTDGVSIVARTWMAAFESFGFGVSTVAGDGAVDHLIPGLAIGAEPTDPAALESQIANALAGVDLVVVENLATLPLNVPAARAVGRVLAGRPAILHHHDPPWHRAAYAHVTELPLDDPAWRHVAINHIAADEMRARGFDVTMIYNGFATGSSGRRNRTRRDLDVAPDTVLLAHPVRAIERKNLPVAIGLAEATGATYWLTGPAEEGYDDQLAALLAGARCPVIHRPSDREDDIYAASDAVLFPSVWEGFGNPPIEASLRRRRCVVGHYPFAGELRRLGFEFLEPGDPPSLTDAIRQPDDAALDHNQALAEEHFSLDRMRDGLRHLLETAGWLP
jgi:glycosyltransferase involved in cell wall biosynthesis